MKRLSILVVLLACFTIAFAAKASMAGEPGKAQRCPYCGGVHAPPYGPGSNHGGYYPGGSGLPQGRRYYNGRYFGNLNNRFYGPQYGYF